MSETCRAPDCDEPTGGYPLRRYCSNVCRNVALEAAERALHSAAEHGTITRPEDLPDRTLAEIRYRTIQSTRKIESEMNAALEDE